MLNRDWTGDVLRPPRRVGPVFLHCAACRLPSTPSGRRVHAVPNAPADVVCAMVLLHGPRGAEMLAGIYA